MLNVTAINFRKKSHERDPVSCRCVSSEHGVGSCRLNMFVPREARFSQRFERRLPRRCCWGGRAAAAAAVASAVVGGVGCGRGAHGSGSSGHGGEFSDLGNGR